jgi:FkbM family methyltransferase
VSSSTWAPTSGSQRLGFAPLFPLPASSASNPWNVSSSNCNGKRRRSESNATNLRFITKSPFANSLAKPAQADEVVTTEKVQVATLDDFAAEFLVDDRIDLLKIDAEGFDLEVLRGAEQLLSAGRILFVLVETGFHPGDDRHPLFDAIRDFLAPYDFRLFGIYDQTHEWAGEHSIQFANVMFVRRSGVE